MNERKEDTAIGRSECLFDADADIRIVMYPLVLTVPVLIQSPLFFSSDYQITFLSSSFSSKRCLDSYSHSLAMTIESV